MWASSKVFRRLLLYSGIFFAFLSITTHSAPLEHPTSRVDPSSIQKVKHNTHLEDRMILLTGPQTWTHNIGDWSINLVKFTFAGQHALRTFQALYDGVISVTAPPYNDRTPQLRTFGFVLGQITLLLLSADERHIPEEMVYRLAIWLQNRAAAGFVGFCSGIVTSTTGQVVGFKLTVRPGPLPPLDPSLG